ncbi:MAG: hypothetical protein FI717_11535 [SAR202 cluster bacterium]|nr:hypothetical protein [SAR202 cluster bacterium]
MTRIRAIKFAVLAAALLALLVACGGGGPGAVTEGVELPIWRYVNSGWVSPRDNQGADAFSRELKAAVITSAEELAQFNHEVVSKRSHGSSTSLGRPEYPGSVVLVAYLMWLPVQGDPLSVTGMEIEGSRVVVQLELEEDSQGRAYPYLFAPMTMVTVDRTDLPDGPVEFEFRLDDQTSVTVTDSLK